MKINFEETERVDYLEYYIKQVLEEIATIVDNPLICESFVSDESILSDFLPIETTQEKYKYFCDELVSHCNIELDINKPIYITEMARKMAHD